jgi:maltose O-acetyltransferase
MDKDQETKRMLAGELFSPFGVGTEDWDRVHTAQKAFNESEFWHDTHALENLRKCFGKAPEDLKLTPPVYFDRGVQVFFGRRFYANTDLTILDENDVRFGDDVMLGPHVSIYSVSHPIDGEIRKTGLEISKPVIIGNGVWIGGNTVINPGVKIGNDTIIGSGSVVTHDIPENVIAAGNPCQVIRPIGEADRAYWQKQYDRYRQSH